MESALLALAGKRLLTAAEVARLTGVPERSLEYFRQKFPQRGPRVTRLGRRVFYRPEDIEKWIDAASSPTSGSPHQRAGLERGTTPKRLRRTP